MCAQGSGWELQTQVTGDDFGEVVENSAIDGDLLGSDQLHQADVRGHRSACLFLFAFRKYVDA